MNLGTGVGSSVLDILHRTAVEAGREVPHDIVEQRVGDLRLSSLTLLPLSVFLAGPPNSLDDIIRCLCLARIASVKLIGRSSL